MSTLSIVSTLEVPFSIGRTWVQVTTPERPRAGALPLIVLHGGPGFAHDYLQGLGTLADRTGRIVVHYDQIGCGRSSHHPEADPGFWTPDLFVREFHAVVSALALGDHHVLGQSWGGMLAVEIASRRPSGLVSLAICNAPASMALWSQAASDLRAELPAAIGEALERHEADATFDDPEYLAASREYDRRHVVRTSGLPAPYAASVAQVDADPTVYHTMNGPNEFHVIGTLRDWTIIDRLEQIEVPALVLAGEFDEAQPIVWEPFVDRIPGARGVLVSGASHCSHLEQPERFADIVGGFLAEHDQLS